MLFYVWDNTKLNVCAAVSQIELKINIIGRKMNVYPLEMLVTDVACDKMDDVEYFPDILDKAIISVDCFGFISIWFDTWSNSGSFAFIFVTDGFRISDFLQSIHWLTNFFKIGLLQINTTNIKTPCNALTMLFAMK